MTKRERKYHRRFFEPKTKQRLLKLRTVYNILFNSTYGLTLPPDFKKQYNQGIASIQYLKKRLKTRYT